MTAIPARAAGVREVLAVCPKPDSSVMFAALEAGVDRMFRIVHRAARMASIGERAGNADGADGVETIGILHHLRFERTGRSGHSGPFERNLGDDFHDALDRRGVDVETCQPLGRTARTERIVAAVKFPVGDIVQQRRQLDDDRIGSL